MSPEVLPLLLTLWTSDVPENSLVCAALCVCVQCVHLHIRASLVQVSTIAVKVALLYSISVWLVCR